MSISKNLLDRQHNSHIENPLDGGDDRRVNDGSVDLSISDGIDLIKGLYPTTQDVVITGRGSHDSFGRLRVSDVNNVFESTHVNGEQTEFWDKSTTGGGSVVYDANKSVVNLNVGTASGDHALRQTMNYFHYAAGQSMIVRFTGVLGAGKTNLNACCGYYDDSNGIVFRVSDGGFQVGIRTDSSGSVVETWVDQADFNLDKMDGTGKSGLTLDLDMAQIFQIEYQWLGVGSVLFSVHIGGVQYHLHKIDHANLVSEVYMRTPHLPLRYEIKNTGITASSSSLNQICTQVANEGRSVVGDLINVVDNGTTTKAINSSSFKPLLSYRHKSGKDILTEIIKIGTLVTTADDVQLEIYVDATLTGVSWTSHSQFIETDTSATSFSGGRKIGSFYINKDGDVSKDELKSKFRLGQYIDGTPQHITVVAKSFVNNASIVSSITFKEIF